MKIAWSNTARINHGEQIFLSHKKVALFFALGLITNYRIKHKPIIRAFPLAWVEFPRFWLLFFIKKGNFSFKLKIFGKGFHLQLIPEKITRELCYLFTVKSEFIPSLHTIAKSTQSCFASSSTTTSSYMHLHAIACKIFVDDLQQITVIRTHTMRLKYMQADLCEEVSYDDLFLH